MSQVARSKEAKKKRPRAEDLALLHALLEALEYDRSLFIKLLHILEISSARSHI